MIFQEQLVFFSINTTLRPCLAKISAHLDPEGPAPEIMASCMGFSDIFTVTYNEMNLITPNFYYYTYHFCLYYPCII